MVLHNDEQHDHLHDEHLEKEPLSTQIIGNLLPKGHPSKLGPSRIVALEMAPFITETQEGQGMASNRVLGPLEDLGCMP